MFSQCNDIHCVCDMLLRIHGHPIRGIWWCASAEVDSLRMRAAYVLACVGVERRKQRGLLISWLCCFSSLLSRLVCFSLPIVDSPFFRLLPPPFVLLCNCLPLCACSLAHVRVTYRCEQATALYWYSPTLMSSSTDFLSMKLSRSEIFCFHSWYLDLNSIRMSAAVIDTRSLFSHSLTNN